MNATESDRVSVPGSERRPLPGARPVAPVDPGQQLNVTVLLRRRGGAELPEPLTGRGQVSRSDFAALYGADPADISKVETFASEHGLQVDEIHPAARTLSLTGTAAAFAAAFQVELRYYEHRGGRYRGREGVITVPASLRDIVIGVFGLDDRPQASPQARIGPAIAKSFTPPQVAQLYTFPINVKGNGQCIAIIELGGGYQAADLQHFFQNLNIPVPTVTPVSVDGAQNNFGDPTNNPDDANSDGEVALDIEIAGAIAPGASIAVYFAPNTDQGFIDAVTTAVHDTTNRPSIISISWGGPEDDWDDQGRNGMDQAFADAAAIGISVFVATGDHGSADRPPLQKDPMTGQLENNPAYDGLAHAGFPASSPHATACGGTHLEGTAATISTETVWNEGNGWATGGGISDYFGLQQWQQNAHLPHSVNAPGARVGRGIPDVSGNADSNTGYQIYFNGNGQVWGGTSAAAPLWAGLCALLNEATGLNLGFLNPALYAPAGTITFRDITSGNNAIAAMDHQVATAGYQAGSGWDACTGLGTPNGSALLVLFATLATPRPQNNTNLSYLWPLLLEEPAETDRDISYLVPLLYNG